MNYKTRQRHFRKKIRNCAESHTVSTPRATRSVNITPSHRPEPDTSDGHGPLSGFYENTEAITASCR